MLLLKCRTSSRSIVTPTVCCLPRMAPPVALADVVLRRGGDTYISFIRSLYDRKMVRYALGSRDQVGVFFVKKERPTSA